MKCPIDNIDLVMSDRQGVEIDYCPKCRGVWLDRGELDKIIERSGSSEPGRPVRDERPASPQGDDRYRSDDDGGYGRDGKPYRKKKSFLDDIFDF